MDSWITADIHQHAVTEDKCGALAGRELRLIHMAASIGVLLASNAIDDTDHPGLKPPNSNLMERNNIAAGHLNLPEDPRVVAGVLQIGVGHRGQ